MLKPSLWTKLCQASATSVQLSRTWTVAFYEIESIFLATFKLLNSDRFVGKTALFSKI